MPRWFSMTAGRSASSRDRICWDSSRRNRVTDMADSQADDYGFETLAIHAGQEPDATTGAVIPPLYLTSTYAQDGVGGLRGGYEYSRSANPTRTALETCLAALEGGTRGFAFASGLAAEDTVLRALCSPGDHVVIPGDAYGGTFRLFARVLERWGLEFTAVDQRDLDAVRAAVTDRTRMIWCETPTNPLLAIADIAALAAVAREADALLAVDNTFASPYLQRPIGLGADIVMHSMTKYLGGHSDVVGGALVVNDDALAEQIAFHHNAMGAVAGAFDSWLVLRGIKTLGVRMDRHCDNAERVVAMLREHAAVAAVHYPDRDEVARKQMARYGGMVSFQVTDGAAKALDICAKTRVFTLAESLGGVESLIEHPAKMTHGSVAGTALEVPADLVRLSVGIETAEDLLADLRQALA
jgi:cystathionine gamma-synthase